MNRARGRFRPSFRVRWWLRTLGREGLLALVHLGAYFSVTTPEYAALVAAERPRRPSPGHPERLVPGRPPGTGEAALWEQFDHTLTHVGAARRP
ncbi:DUF6059 family protein [Streptacidiphilus jiangxiensis]|uniref:Uncharacterized protein n=1 Tax=Streptacidiphilus jiangxiensis TaxID=235985 RepID=A0A1H7I9A3_STRJI|nr:DUF6059 family protein [Streptacidiphilus jiangxiensis]SEK59008.1 hypothetical protein SAMN05414137_102554 [Streptacidiphilus jiangxiensis]